MKRRVLVTGFEPFAGARYNPSAQIAGELNGQRIRGREIHAVVLPVVFGESGRLLRQAIRALDPELVICLGLAGGRRAISLERVAVNFDDARIADNAGQQPVDVPIVGRGAKAYFTSLPVKAMAAALSEQAFPVALSGTAGNFVCNHVFYHLMRTLSRRPNVRGGFIHVPPYRKQFSQAAMTEAIRLAITTALRIRSDLKVPGGAID